MTREEAKSILINKVKPCMDGTEWGEALDIAIKALGQEPREDATLQDIFCMGCEYKEQEPILDKIRAEISDFEEEVFNRPNTDYSDYAAVRHCLQIIDKYRESEHKRLIDADELLKRISEKAKIPSLSEATINGLCGATAIIYDMLNESEVDNADSN